jgi:hypothetical protein
LVDLEILDHVLGGLDDDRAARVEALASRTPRDLLKVADAQDRGLFAVELAELCKEHRPDRHVDADAECVGAADDLEQALLRKPLDEDAVLGQ